MNALIVYEIMCAKTFKDSKGQENLRFFSFDYIKLLYLFTIDRINYFGQGRY